MKVIAEVAIEAADPRALFFAAVGAAGARGMAPAAYLSAREASGDPAAHDVATLLTTWRFAPDFDVNVLEARTVRRPVSSVG